MESATAINPCRTDDRHALHGPASNPGLTILAHGNDQGSWQWQLHSILPTGDGGVCKLALLVRHRRNVLLDGAGRQQAEDAHGAGLADAVGPGLGLSAGTWQKERLMGFAVLCSFRTGVGFWLCVPSFE